MTFSKSDLEFITARGSKPDTVSLQLKNFKDGFPYLPVTRPATIDDGVIRLEKEEIEALDSAYERILGAKHVIKFVPASGAASRMFKDLFAFVQGDKTEPEGKPAEAWQNLMAFAFFDKLVKAIPEDKYRDAKFVFKTLLGDEGLGYGKLPKGLLDFHRYDDGVRTPFEEHLVEAAHYSKDDKGMARLHFTVSPEHRQGFTRLLDEVYEAYKEKYGADFDVSFSEQKPSTDTIAVDMENKPFRLDNGNILFRPGGHGALIENLNELDADLVFIKNIDNVCPDSMKQDTYQYKRALASLLLNLQLEVFGYIEEIDAGEIDMQEVEGFVRQRLCVEFPASYDDFSEDKKLHFLRSRLDRPMRVCGMVKNEGEPGGGPFWTRMSDGTTTLQIVESAQLDPNNEEVQGKVQQATHFNPVDLICAIKDHRGEKYDLRRYVDPRTGFITEKSLEGRALKAQELPGLWNGAMAHWNTIFVEVPISTFNPVKTVNDLLRPQHQA